MNLTKTQKMMLGQAIGDAYASAYEFVKPIQPDWTRYSKHPSLTFTTTPPGMYTDDTQMSIGVAKTLLYDNIPFTKEQFAKHFFETFKGKPINGYSRAFQAILEKVNNVEELLATIRADSTKNGAAMRSLPLGVLPNPKIVMDCAKINASVTHNTPEGILSSQAMALAAHKELYDIKGELRYYLTYHLKREFHDFAPEPWIPSDALPTIDAVVYLVEHAKSAQELLAEAVYLGGDTDSVAGLALGLYAINHSLEDLPEFLIKDLYNGKDGKDYLLNLGFTLGKKYHIPEQED